MIALILAAAVGVGLAILPAMRHDRDEYHLMHGPKSGCADCSDK